VNVPINTQTASWQLTKNPFEWQQSENDGTSFKACAEGSSRLRLCS
jgi:hypothetical protein